MQILPIDDAEKMEYTGLVDSAKGIPLQKGDLSKWIIPDLCNLINQSADRELAIAIAISTIHDFLEPPQSSQQPELCSLRGRY